MSISFKCDSRTAVVHTGSGDIRGYEYNGLNIFKGIPYAKARRFHAPEKVEPWKDVFDAASYGYVCPLLTNDRPKGELYVPHRFWCGCTAAGMRPALRLNTSPMTEPIWRASATA